MKIKLVPIAIALCFAHSGLYAQDVNPTAPQDPTPEISTRPVSFLLGGGITQGGDTLATATFTDGSSQSIRGGGLVYFKAGADWRVSPIMSIQGTFGYHADSVSAKNGGLKFERTFPRHPRPDSRSSTLMACR